VNPPVPGTGTLAPNDPFKSNRAKPAEEMPAPTEETTEPNLFPTEPATPMEDDPFGASPKTDTKPAAGAEPDNPFGG
jgi:hypothetical protein